MQQAIITIEKHNQLSESLLYLHVAELKQIAHKLELHATHGKANLIAQIMLFISTGKKIGTITDPPISCGKHTQQISLTPQTKMLKGQYKNDANNRLFFKKLIGPHFHFTAYGIDWLNAQWISGNPPHIPGIC